MRDTALRARWSVGWPRGGATAFFVYSVGIGLTSQLVIARIVVIDTHGVYAYAFAWIVVLAYFSTLDFDVGASAPCARWVPATCPCCGDNRLRKIGEDVTEVLELIPRQWKVIQHVREKFVCRTCEAITQPAAPSHPIARGRAGPKRLAHILFAKYSLHLQLNRQSDVYQRDRHRSRTAEQGADRDRGRSARVRAVAQCGLRSIEHAAAAAFEAMPAVGVHARSG